MKYKDITSFICPTHGWVKGRKCRICGVCVIAGDMCQSERVNEEGFTSTLYDVYRPPRPLDMTPIAYYKKHGCVDDHYARKTKGRYYCNPAHCKRSWKSKKKRDEHLERAYNLL